MKDGGGQLKRRLESRGKEGRCMGMWCKERSITGEYVGKRVMGLEGLNEDGPTVREIISKRRDCQARKCTTESHGGVFHHTSTQLVWLRWRGEEVLRVWIVLIAPGGIRTNITNSNHHDHAALTGVSTTPDMCWASAWRSIWGESSTIRCTDIWMNSSKESSCCRTSPFSSKYELITIQQDSCQTSERTSSASSSSYTSAQRHNERVMTALDGERLNAGTDGENTKLKYQKRCKIIVHVLGRVVRKLPSPNCPNFGLERNFGRCINHLTD